MTEMKRRSLEEVKALSEGDAVDIMRHAGIVGAGGAGFPTYFKYEDPQPHLIINATESEPGYQADKAVHKEYFDEFLVLYEALGAIFGFERISMGVHEKDREWYADYQEHADDGFYDMRYVPNGYSLGQEKILIRHATDAEVPWRVETSDGEMRPGMPPDAGITVNNSETLLNIYNALFLGRPTTTKFMSVYGEGTEVKVYEAPVGASVTEVLRIAGVDVEDSGHLTVLDGGPYLHEVAIEELGNGDAFIRRMTNSLFLIPKGDKGRYHAGITTDPPEEGIVSLVGRVSGVSVPLGDHLLKPAEVLVSEGDEVEYEQKIGEPVDEGFSVGIWASAGGTVDSIEDGVVAISGGALPQEEAEAEAEAEASREVPGDKAEAEAETPR